MEPMRKCTLCPSHKYSYCNKCKAPSLIEPWRMLFDSETCRDVYHILSEFAFGRKTAIEARSELENYEVPNKEDMTSSLRKNLEDVYEQTKNYGKKKEEPITISPIDNTEYFEEPIEEIKPRRRRYSRRKHD